MITIWSSAAILAVMLLGTIPAGANTYPSGVKIIDSDLLITTCDPVMVRYVLNENADGDGTNPGVRIQVLKASDNTIIRTVDTASQTKGIQTFIWDKRNDGGQKVGDDAYKIVITTADNGYSSWTMISTDSVQNNFGVPRGVAVNKNPGSVNYGRVYVSQANNTTTVAGRTMGDGLYLLNADLSDAVGQGDNPLTGGVAWNVASTASPMRVEVGPDDQVYITDWSDVHSGLWVADPDVTTAVEVLDNTNQDSTGLNAVHGSIPDVVILGLGDLRTLYTIDEDFLGGGTAVRAGSVWKYPIGTVVTTSTPPTVFYDDEAAGDKIVNYTASLAVDDDGTFWISQYRAGLTTETYPSLMQLDANGAIVWSSVPALGATSAADPLRGTQGMAIDPSRNRVALVTNRTQTTPAYQGLIIIFNTATKSIESTFFFDPTSATTNTDACFDAVGNLYVGNRSKERMRVWSPPGGNHTNSTTSATFTLSGAGSGGPTITDQPDSITVCPNSTATFSVNATGAGTLKYRWAQNGEEIAGQSGNGSPILSMTATLADSGSQITVSVCDNNGVTVSNAATLSVYGPPVISKQPISQGAVAGDALPPLTVTASSTVTPNPALSYQWKKTLNTVTTNVGTNSPTLTLGTATSADNGAQFGVEITDSCGNITVSGTVVLNIVRKACNSPFADIDNDNDVDQMDFGLWQICYSGPEPFSDVDACGCLDRNDDSKVNAIDLVDFIACAAASGPSIPAGPACGGTVLFQDDFDAGNSTANWTLKTTSADNTVNFAYDYSTAGIPPAPRTKGGTTKGAFMSVNDDATATVEAAIAYANTVDFTNDFTLTFDMWMNYSGVATTEFSVFGINGDGTSILVPTLGVNSPPTAGTGPTSAGYLFSVDGESGTVRDYRVYEGAVELLGASGGLIAPAGNQDASSSTPYSLIFPAPKSLFLGAPGNNGPGNGWGWARVEIKHTATGIVTWKLNDTVVATRSATAYPSGKIMIGYMDMFSSISSAGTYVVYDNVLVTAP